MKGGEKLNRAHQQHNYSCPGSSFPLSFHKSTFSTNTPRASSAGRPRQQSVPCRAVGAARTLCASSMRNGFSVLIGLMRIWPQIKNHGKTISDKWGEMDCQVGWSFRWSVSLNFPRPHQPVSTVRLRGGNYTKSINTAVFWILLIKNKHGWSSFKHRFNTQASSNPDWSIQSSPLEYVRAETSDDLSYWLCWWLFSCLISESEKSKSPCTCDFLYTEQYVH